MKQKKILFNFIFTVAYCGWVFEVAETSFCQYTLHALWSPTGADRATAAGSREVFHIINWMLRIFCSYLNEPFLISEFLILPLTPFVYFLQNTLHGGFSSDSQETLKSRAKICYLMIHCSSLSDSRACFNDNQINKMVDNNKK